MNKVAILIPTLNRSEFLIRQLDYYVSVNSPHTVYIGDSSDLEHKKTIEEAINSLDGKIEIKYYHWPEKNDRQCIASLGDEAYEEYCVITGDDDFLIPDSLTKCATFLSNNPKYRTCQGVSVLFTIDKPGPYGSLNGVGEYWFAGQKFEEESSVERILQFAKNYWVPQFSVHRTSEFIKDSLKYRNIVDKSFGELIHSFTFIAKGKSMFLNCLYLIRQGHNSRYFLPDIFDWMENPDWNYSYQYFIDALAIILAEVDGLEKKKAHEFVKQAFWAYLLRGLCRKYEQKYGELFSSKLNSHEIVREKNNELTLPLLLNPSSKYHHDFLPIHNSITKESI